MPYLFRMNRIWTFTYWTPQEVVDFVKQYGAKIRETGVRLMSPEACGTPPEYTDPIINDAGAFAQTDIIAGTPLSRFYRPG